MLRKIDPLDVRLSVAAVSIIVLLFPLVFLVFFLVLMFVVVVLVIVITTVRPPVRELICQKTIVSFLTQ